LFTAASLRILHLQPTLPLAGNTRFSDKFYTKLIIRSLNQYNFILPLLHIRKAWLFGDIPVAFRRYSIAFSPIPQSLFADTL